MVTASPVGAPDEVAREDVPVAMVELSDEPVAEAEDSVLVADAVLDAVRMSAAMIPRTRKGADQ